MCISQCSPLYTTVTTPHTSQQLIATHVCFLFTLRAFHKSATALLFASFTQEPKLMGEPNLCVEHISLIGERKREGK